MVDTPSRLPYRSGLCELAALASLVDTRPRRSSMGPEEVRLGLREDAKLHVDAFIEGSKDIGALARWLSSNTRAVNATGDDETRVLVGKARQTIDAFLHERVDAVGARDHLSRLIMNEGTDAR